MTLGPSFNQPLNHYSIPFGVTHLTFDWDFCQILNSQSIPINLTQLNFWGDKHVEIDGEILDRIELEINYNCENIYYDKSRIINLFTWNHNAKIQRVNMDEYVVEDEWNDYIGDWPVTKIKLIPKNILRSRTKSAKKIL